MTLAHALAVASPGPDFALVLRQSMRHGRTTALASASGIGAGILVHATYSVLGIGLMVQKTPTLFATLKYVSAAYFLWLGWGAWRASFQPGGGDGAASVAPPHPRKAWWRGFFTNVLNLKASLFFVALFSVVVDPATPRWVQGAYGVWMALTTTAWFSLVAIVFTRPAVNRGYHRLQPVIDRAMGTIFILFAMNLWLSELIVSG